MWGGEPAGWCGALAAAALLLLLLLALRCRARRKTAHRPHRTHRAPPPPAQVLLASLAPPPPPPLRASAPPLAGAPPPQIVVVQNVAPGPSPAPAPASPRVPRLPPPERWLHQRRFDYKYSSTIPRPLAQLVAPELGAELAPPGRDARIKKFSATRSPSLEKDDKSPFLTGAKSDESEVFGFDTEVLKRAARTSSEERSGEMSERAATMSPKEREGGDEESSGSLRRFRSVSTKLNAYGEPPLPEPHYERLEMQNSPRVVECNSAKEKSAVSKFDFSPKLLAESLTSPRFFTPPETVSPMFFAEPSPKSVYYDSVRSPKFFAETPREADAAQAVPVAPVPQSPRALGASVNRNTAPGSPRVLAARPSPKLLTCNKENYFTFDHVSIAEEGSTRMSPRPRRYGGRNSIERERFTPPVDKEAKKYRRHNSCDTNYKNIELNICSRDESVQNDQKESVITEDVVDCCAKMDSIQLEVKIENEKSYEMKPSNSISGVSAQVRRDKQRLKSISLDSDNAKIIEQNLGLPIAKQMKDQMNEAYKNQEVSTSFESIERYPKTPPSERPTIKFDNEKTDQSAEEEPKSPDLTQRKCLRHSSDTQSFLDMPRFSPKEFEITVTNDEGATTSTDTHNLKKKNHRNLTIDLTKRDSDLEKELLEFEKLYTDKKVKTPTLKVKATSLDSSDGVNLSLPQQKTLDVPQNSISMPNTPKRQLKRLLAQKNGKHDPCGAKIGYNSIQSAAEQRRLFMKGQDSGIFLRENHANLMLYQPGSSRLGSRTMGSFDENMSENAPEINISGVDGNSGYLDPGLSLCSNLVNYKQNLSVSSTNLKTLPEGVPSDDFEPSAEDEKIVKKLYRRNSNQSLMLSTHSLQGSNCSLNTSGASCHNIASVRNSMSNFSLNSQKMLSFDRRDSNTSLMNAEHLTPTTRVICSSNTSLAGESSKNCLLQRRGSNNSLTLNIQGAGLSRHSSNSSLNKEAKPVQKKGLLERRSSNTSLTLNINNSNPQLSVVNRGLSVSNYNLNGSTCSLSRYNSNQSIDVAEPKKGILERRSSNTSLTLNIQPQEPRDVEIDENAMDKNLKDLPHRETHRKSLSTENLIPKSYKTRTRVRNNDKPIAFGSHDNLWSQWYAAEHECPQNLTYVCGDNENEMIYAFARPDEPTLQPGFVRNITTKPLSPQSTSEDFRLYLANMQHLQNASSVLTRQQLRDLDEVFQNGYSKVKCLSSSEGQHCCSGRVSDSDAAKENPQLLIPEPVSSHPCSEYQKMLLRNLHHEFWDMPTNFQEKPIVSGSHTKNRYKTILPNEHSRFILRPPPAATVAAAAAEGYINANFIKGHEYTKNSYIATQGPLQNTIYDFWLMVYQNSIASYGSGGVQKVVMLTNFVENNRHKCERYFPLELHSETYRGPDGDGFCVTNRAVTDKTGYTIRDLEVEYGGRSVSVYHYWFHNWADHKCPKDVTALLELSLDVLDYRAAPPAAAPPTVVHCSAGIGRTGCLIAVLNGIEQLLAEQKVDVLGIVCNMRLNRGGMVQNSEQYELIHKVLCLFERTRLPAAGS